MDSWDSVDNGEQDACDDEQDWRDVACFVWAVHVDLSDKVVVTLDSTSNCSLLLWELLHWIFEWASLVDA